MAKKHTAQDSGTEGGQLAPDLLTSIPFSLFVISTLQLIDGRIAQVTFYIVSRLLRPSPLLPLSWADWVALRSLNFRSSHHKEPAQSHVVHQGNSDTWLHDLQNEGTIRLQGWYILTEVPASIKLSQCHIMYPPERWRSALRKEPWLEAGIDRYRRYLQAQIFILYLPSQGCCTRRLSVDGVEEACYPLNLPELRAYWDSTLFGSRQQQLLACQTSSRQYSQYRQQQQHTTPRSLFIYFPAPSFPFPLQSPWESTHEQSTISQ